MITRPFFSYFGGKWRAASKYPRPRHETIVEPFAGGAGYASRYPWKKVVLIDKDPVIAGLWRYLTKVRPEEILRLPDVPHGRSLDELQLTQEQRWLIGFWLVTGVTGPRKKAGSWAKNNPVGYWGPRIRSMLASQVPAIRHWRVIEGSYTDAPDVEATWYVDPPYQEQGWRYTCGSDGIDFDHLGEWCRSRTGQVMVCEQHGAKWLPFRPLYRLSGSIWDSTEVIWMNEENR